MERERERRRPEIGAGGGSGAGDRRGRWRMGGSGQRRVDPGASGSEELRQRRTNSRPPREQHAAPAGSSCRQRGLTTGSGRRRAVAAARGSDERQGLGRRGRALGARGGSMWLRWRWRDPGLAGRIWASAGPRAGGCDVGACPDRWHVLVGRRQRADTSAARILVRRRRVEFLGLGVERDPGFLEEGL